MDTLWTLIQAYVIIRVLIAILKLGFGKRGKNKRDRSIVGKLCYMGSCRIHSRLDKYIENIDGKKQNKKVVNMEEYR